eukprot:TRINITY_DN67743_c10_g1_i3.p1 TRINITY_DN67743_c10_g1~~TRINITY_DN67743_c10_g1_i3.p1  ORF type:complete len:276 (+),score=14.04 TRINITY_DN67743_c10_g1_i3:118-828(+)
MKIAVLCMNTAYQGDSSIPWDLVELILRHCEDPDLRWSRRLTHLQIELQDDETKAVVDARSFQSYGTMCASLVQPQDHKHVFTVALDSPKQDLCGLAILYIGFACPHEWEQADMYPRNKAVWFRMSGEVTRVLRSDGQRLSARFPTPVWDAGVRQETFTVTVDVQQKTIDVVAHSVKKKFVVCANYESDQWWIEPPFSLFVSLDCNGDAATLLPPHCARCVGHDCEVVLSGKVTAN